MLNRTSGVIFVLYIKTGSCNFADLFKKDMSLGTTVNNDKNGVLLAYIANNIPDIHLRKILKIIYLMDEHFMRMRGFPLTWFDYYAWAKGPVASEVYDIKNGAFGNFVSYHRGEGEKRIVNLIPDVGKRLKESFSKSETIEIDRLIEAYGACTADELSDLTHVEDSLWSKAVADNRLLFDEDNKTSDCPIRLEWLFSDSDWKAAAYKDARWSMEFQARLSSSRNPGHRIQLQVVSPSEREQYHIPVYSPAIPSTASEGIVSERLQEVAQSPRSA